MDRIISCQAAIDALCDNCDNAQAVCPHYPCKQYTAIDVLPSAQPEQEREFIKLTVRDSNGRPYYSIIYLVVDENGVGHDVEGYSSYDLDTISYYLTKYFGIGHSNRKTGRWMFTKYYTWECSECGESPTKGTGYTQSSDELYAFCPHCGSYNGGEN